MHARLQNPYLLLVLTVLRWSGSMVVGGTLRERTPPLALAFSRCACWGSALIFAGIHLTTAASAGTPAR
jgi:hypothetical protein